MIAEIVSVGVAAGAVISFFRWRARKVAEWREASTVLGGRLVSDFKMEAEIEGVSLFLVSRADSPFQVTASTAPLRGCAFVARPKFGDSSALLALVETLSQRHVTMDAGEFDASFTVRSNVAALARTWLSRDVQHAMRGLPYFSFELEGDILIARGSRGHLSAGEIVTVARTVAFVAGRAARLEGEWRALALALAGVLDENTNGFIVRFERHGAVGAIELSELPRRSGAPHYVRGVRVAGVTEAFVIRAIGADLRISEGALFDCGDMEVATRFAFSSSEPERTSRRLTADLRRDLLTLAPLAVVGAPEGVVVFLEGTYLEIERTRAAVALAVALLDDAAHVGPYR